MHDSSDLSAKKATASMDFIFNEKLVSSECATFLRWRLLDKFPSRKPDPPNDEYFDLIENERPLKFLIGLILRVCLSTVEPSHVQAVVDSYNAKEILHNIIRGRIDHESEAQAISIVAWLASNILENCAEIPYQVRDIEVCLPTWSSKKIDAPLFLQSYCEQRCIGKQHEEALGMAVEPNLYSIFLLGDVLPYLRETYSSLVHAYAHAPASAHAHARAHQARDRVHLILNEIGQILQSVTEKSLWPISGPAFGDAKRIYSLYGDHFHIKNQLLYLSHDPDDKKIRIFMHTFDSFIKLLDDTIRLLVDHAQSGAQCLETWELIYPIHLRPSLQDLRVRVRRLKDMIWSPGRNIGFSIWYPDQIKDVLKFGTSAGRSSKRRRLELH